MPWAPLMMMPDRGQLYDAMAQAYAPQPQVDPAAYSAALAGVDAGALAYQPSGYPEPAQVPYDPAFAPPLVPVDTYAGVPQGPYVSPTYDSAQRLLDENEALLRAIYANANF